MIWFMVFGTIAYLILLILTVISDLNEEINETFKNIFK